jgi:hypothetical protein
MNRFFALISLALLCSFASAETAKQAFDHLKSLAGEWKGTCSMGNDMPVKVTYKVTAGGSTIVETLFAGEPHEMMTMYHMDGDKLMLTHYCAAQNQPTLKWVASKDSKTMEFDFVSGTNMKLTDTHMHHATIQFVDADHIRSDWMAFTGGKASGHEAKFDIRRVKN